MPRQAAEPARLLMALVLAVSGLLAAAPIPAAAAELSAEDQAAPNAVAAVGAPDLVIETVAGPMGMVYGASTFFINGSLRNAGTADSGLDVSVQGFHPLFGNQTSNVGPLAPGQAAAFSLAWDATGIPRGSYSFVVSVDPDDLIVETNESNNTQPVQIQVEDRPDLVLDGLFADPVSGYANDSIDMNLSLRNLGAAVTGSVDAWVYLDDASSTTTLNRTATWTLAVGLEHGGRANFSFPWALPALVPGPHLVRAWVDGAGALDEISETNNNGSVQVTVRSAPLPDLALVSASLSAASYRDGETGAVAIDVSNLGVNYTGDLVVRLVDATLNLTLASAALPPVAHNGTQHLTLEFTASGPILGAHAVLALVDPEDLLDEATELNNVVTLNFTLQRAAAPNLVVTRLTVSPATPTQGDTVRFEAEVSNTGTAAAAATRLSFLHGTSSLGDLPVPALETGASAVVSVDWNTSQLTSLSALVTAQADSSGILSELDEGDNHQTLTVQFQRAGSADIELVDLTATAQVPRGGRAEVTVRVVNRGTAPGTGVLELRIDGAFLATFNFTLTPGENRSFTTSWNATTSGSHNVRAELSLSGEVVEQSVAAVEVQRDAAAPAYSVVPYVLGAAAIAAAAVLVLWLRRARKPDALGKAEDSPSTPSDPGVEGEPGKKAP
jgi:subtilase family serine protease